MVRRPAHTPGTFRFAAKIAFLTYPNLNGEDAAHRCFEHDEAFEHYSAMAGIKWARICTEPHDNGVPHIHAVVAFESVYDTTNCRAFDVDGVHCKVEQCRNKQKSADYLAKHGVFTDYGDVPTGGRGAKRTIREVAAMAGGDEYEYLCAAAEIKLQGFYTKRFRELSTVEARRDNTVYEFDHPERESAQFEGIEPQENRSTVIVGPSGCGKSSWAKRIAPKPALMISHMDGLREFDGKHHKSIIFDDMKFTHMPVQAQIHIVDMYDARQIHCRYQKVDIPAGVPRFFTCNEQPFVDHEAIERRVLRVNILP